MNAFGRNARPAKAAHEDADEMQVEAAPDEAEGTDAEEDYEAHEPTPRGRRRGIVMAAGAGTGALVVAAVVFFAFAPGNGGTPTTAVPPQVAQQRQQAAGPGTPPWPPNPGGPGQGTAQQAGVPPQAGGTMPASAPPDQTSSRIEEMRRTAGQQNQVIQGQQRTLVAMEARIDALSARLEEVNARSQAAAAQPAVAGGTPAMPATATEAPPAESKDDPPDQRVVQGSILTGVSKYAVRVSANGHERDYAIGSDIPGVGKAARMKPWGCSWELVTTAGMVRPANDGCK